MGMKNWFKNVDLFNFAKTQKQYVDQIDQYMKGGIKGHKRNKTYFGGEREQILKKIEKGYQVAEIDLQKVTKNDRQAPIGSTALYNKFLIKVLCQFRDPYIRQKYVLFLKSLKDKTKDNQNVYQRMNKDINRRATVYHNTLSVDTRSISNMGSFRSSHAE
jgi:hypothetical protein